MSKICQHAPCRCDVKNDEDFCCGACAAAHAEGRTETCVCPHDCGGAEAEG